MSNDFKVGDVVVCTDNSGISYLIKEGHLFTVLVVFGSGLLGLKVKIVKLHYLVVGLS